MSERVNQCINALAIVVHPGNTLFVYVRATETHCARDKQHAPHAVRWKQEGLPACRVPPQVPRVVRALAVVNHPIEERPRREVLQPNPKGSLLWSSPAMRSRLSCSRCSLPAASLSSHSGSCSCTVVGVPGVRRWPGDGAAATWASPAPAAWQRAGSSDAAARGTAAKNSLRS
jgi:hypothetical protein